MFKAKIFKLGNSRAIYLPKEVWEKLEIGKEYEWSIYDVYTGESGNALQQTLLNHNAKPMVHPWKKPEQPDHAVIPIKD